MSLSQNIRAAREAAGFTVADVARAVDCRENTIYRWERGERTPHIPTLEKLAKALGTTGGKLLR